MVEAGDRLRVTSSLEEPEDFEGFAYREYLARQGVAAIASSRGVSVVGHELGPVADALHGARSWLLAGLNRLVPEPEAALAAGILLGVRSGIDPAINDAFARAGLTHVVAISGWNIAIVAAIAAAASRPLTRLPSGPLAGGRGGDGCRRGVRPAHRRLAVGGARGADGRRHCWWPGWAARVHMPCRP